jgi:prepilin-type N-terminal cleavage/methylation domain-containing protein
MFKHKYRQFGTKGFSYPEVLIVVVIIAITFLITFPMYKRFNALTELKNTAQAVRDQLRIAHNKSLNGVIPSNNMISHWVFHVHKNDFEYEYESAACPVIEDPSATGYSNRYTFNSCPERSDYALYDFPLRFNISHQYSNETEANLFFESISGNMKVYNSNGVYLGDTIDIRIASDEYPDIYLIFHVNSAGGVSEEKF